ncbi:MAG: HlyD family secretion protein [Deltaproteobacteria bacterium]|jgi:membrane fusion protein (multidrug efflux system)|nr:HlyD family secretion protein [Deltaproteobacteria bacterium]
MKRWQKRTLLALAGTALLAAVLPGHRLYRYYATHVATDDAYVDGTMALVTSRVAGTVVKLYVDDNWRVKAQQPLLELDPRDYAVQVAQNQAQLDRARQDIDQLFAQLAAARAALKLAEAQLKQARLDHGRARALWEAKVVSRAYYDQAVTALKVALSARALAQHQVAEVRAALGGTLDGEAGDRYRRPIVQQAQAQLAQAELQLSYTQLRAPFGGIVSRKSVEVGQRVEAGQPLMAVVSTDRLYITANFKETALTHVRVGQPAEVRADIYPAYVFHGRVDSLAMGTGAAFALLPPENATGNWVKVVQRLPVRVVLDRPPPADKPLRLGLSVEVAIDVSDTRGPLLSSTLQHAFDRRQPIYLPPLSLPVGPIPGAGGAPAGPAGAAGRDGQALWFGKAKPAR